uniref:Uncharacterized protein n=1 Tax=Glossina brevipalpis TaxID=37001 RepID=A0A1A9W668_9MUSC
MLDIFRGLKSLIKVSNVEADSTKQGVSVPYPGIGNSDGDVHEKKHYKYYQWVCFCLFLQVRYIH